MGKKWRGKKEKQGKKWTCPFACLLLFFLLFRSAFFAFVLLLFCFFLLFAWKKAK